MGPWKLVNSVPEDENAPTVVVTPSLDVGVGHKEHGKDDGDDIPSRQDQT